MLKRTALFINICLFLLMGCHQNSKMERPVGQNVKPDTSLSFTEDSRIEKIFTDSHTTGTFVVMNEKGQLTGYNRERAFTRFIPASTFKIANSLIALTTGVVKDVDEVFFVYDGTPLYLSDWEHDMNMRDAIKVSNVNAYQELAQRIGLKQMSANVQKLHYGNEDIGTSVDQFWLEGPLKISAVEQTQFLMSLAKNKLNYPIENQKAVADITVFESGNNWVLHAKTGLASTEKEPAVGWCVGWVEQKGQIYSYAFNMLVTPADTLSKRLELTKQSLKAVGLLDTEAP